MEDLRTCWHCGAPADPEDVLELELVSSGGLYALGYPVTRGRPADRVRVQIPRCYACRERTSFSIGDSLIGAAVGLAAGVVIYQSASGAVMSALAGFLLGAGVPVCRGISRRTPLRLRSTQDFPRLMQLRAFGWREPDSDGQ